MFKKRVVYLHTLVSLFISQSIFWLIYLNLDKLPPEIPLWYLQPWGPAQLASLAAVWLLPGLAIGILTINLLITVFILYRRQPFIVGLLMGSTTLFNLYLLITTLNLLNRVLGWW